MSTNEQSLTEQLEALLSHSVRSVLYHCMAQVSSRHGVKRKEHSQLDNKKASEDTVQQFSNTVLESSSRNVVDLCLP